MSTLQEQMREAASQCSWVDGDPDGIRWAEASADAAYAVAEPILRALVDEEPCGEIQGYTVCMYCDGEAKPFFDRPDDDDDVIVNHKPDCAWVRAKEALG